MSGGLAGRWRFDQLGYDQRNLLVVDLMTVQYGTLRVAGTRLQTDTPHCETRNTAPCDAAHALAVPVYWTGLGARSSGRPWHTVLGPGPAPPDMKLASEGFRPGPSRWAEMARRLGRSR